MSACIARLETLQGLQKQEGKTPRAKLKRPSDGIVCATCNNDGVVTVISLWASHRGEATTICPDCRGNP